MIKASLKGPRPHTKQLPTEHPNTALTRVAHELARNFLVAATAAEDLAAQSTVVTASERRELLVAVVALFTLAVRHPVLLKIAVLGHKGRIYVSHLSTRYGLERCSGYSYNNQEIRT